MPTRTVMQSLSTSIEWHSALSLGRQALAWWLGELESCLPRRLGLHLLRSSDASLILELSRSSIRICDGVGNLLTVGAPDAALAEIAKQMLNHPDPRKDRSPPVVVALDSSLVLNRNIVLPEAATTSLSMIIRHQIPKFVPMAADDVIGIHEVVARQVSTKTMTVQVTLVKRSTLTWAQDLVAGSGLKIHRVVADRPNRYGSTERAVLWRPSETRSRRLLEVIAQHKVAVVVVCLLLFASTMHVIRVHVLDDRLSEEVVELHHKATDVLALNERLRTERKQLTFLQHRASDISAADVLARLTRLLPSDVSLTEFTYQTGAVTCVGKARHAATLIGIIESSGVFNEPHFISATTPSADGTSETFELAFSVHRMSANE